MALYAELEGPSFPAFASRDGSSLGPYFYDEPDADD